MKMRYDKLIVVRAAASRSATVAFANSAANFARQTMLRDRIDSAATALSPETGVATAAMLAGRNELLGRMHAARCVATVRVEDSQSELNDVAVARRTARRALDAAVDIRREYRRAAAFRAEAKSLPTPPKIMR